MSREEVLLLRAKNGARSFHTFYRIESPQKSRFTEKGKQGSEVKELPKNPSLVSGWTWIQILDSCLTVKPHFHYFMFPLPRKMFRLKIETLWNEMQTQRVHGPISQLSWWHPRRQLLSSLINSGSSVKDGALGWPLFHMVSSYIECRWLRGQAVPNLVPIHSLLDPIYKGTTLWQNHHVLKLLCASWQFLLV